MKATAILSLDPSARAQLWQRVFQEIETYFLEVPRARVAPVLDPVELRERLAPLDFMTGLEPLEAVDFAIRGLWNDQVHTPHPRYFGLFNPAPSALGVAADALVAAFNPQLAAWSHNPFADEIERHLVQTFAARFGYQAPQADGTFTSGGAEANHTALLTALVHAFPDFAKGGLRSLDRQPVLYGSTQSHHSFIKAARACGLGSQAVRSIPVDDSLQMDAAALQSQIVQDRAAGCGPFFVTATAGSTSAGVVDPIKTVAEIARSENLWFHVDAAWGGGAIFDPDLMPLLVGVELSDSVTFDAHKWLSVPMAAGMYLTRHPTLLAETFRITTDYMPADASGLDITDPYTHSMQWSRRFIGLKVFLTLLAAGWEGYRLTIQHQTAMGELLRRELEGAGWEVVNKTRLPVVCFVDRQNPQGRSAGFIEAVAREVVASGQAWISTTRLDHDAPVLRACITNYRTDVEDVHTLVEILEKARQIVRSRGS